VAVLAGLQLAVEAAVADYCLEHLAQFQLARRLQLMWVPVEPVPLILFQAAWPITGFLATLPAQRFQQ
jgi:hypothetical protein